MAEQLSATSNISHYHAFLKVLTLQPFTRMEWAARVRKKVSELVRKSEIMEPLITDTAVVIPSEPGEFVDAELGSVFAEEHASGLCNVRGADILGCGC